jgi:hypothetical protein
MVGRNYHPFSSEAMIKPDQVLFILRTTVYNQDLIDAMPADDVFPDKPYDILSRILS